MSIVVLDSTTTNDSVEKTLTLSDILIRCQDYCGDTTGLVRQQLIRWINSVLGEMFTDTKPKWMLAESGLETIAEYSTGNAAVTKGDATVTFGGGAAITSSHVGRKFWIPGSNYAYVIGSRTSGTEVELADTFMEESQSGVDFKIVEDTFTLPSDFDLPRVVDQRFGSIRMGILDTLPLRFRVGQRPVLCKITVDKKLVVYPAPDRLMKIDFEYFRAFSLLSDTSEEIHLPDRYVHWLCCGVARNYWMSRPQSKEKFQNYRMFSDEFKDGVIQIRKDKYNDDSQLVQFTPYKSVGSSNLSGYHDIPHPADLLS